MQNDNQTDLKEILAQLTHEELLAYVCYLERCHLECLEKLAAAKQR